MKSTESRNGCRWKYYNQYTVLIWIVSHVNLHPCLFSLIYGSTLQIMGVIEEIERRNLKAIDITVGRRCNLT
jgi:hypothetical protein